MAEELLGVDRREKNKVRPWTVYVLTVVGIAGLVWGLIVDGDRNLWDIPTSLLSLWIAYSLWAGKRWAFTLSFVLSSLCAALLVLVGGVQLFLLEQSIPSGVVWGFVPSAIWLALLMHPATKRFAGLDGAGHMEEEAAAV